MQPKLPFRHAAHASLATLVQPTQASKPHAAGHLKLHAQGRPAPLTAMLCLDLSFPKSSAFLTKAVVTV